MPAALPAGGPSSSLIDQIVREGARQMLAAALQAEVAAYIDQFAGERGEDGRRLVVRNGTAEPRTVLTSAGAVEVTAPRVNDKRTDPAAGGRARFSSAILPPWAGKTPQVTEVLPLLYLHGLSSGDFGLALAQFLGTGTGLSAPVISRLTQTWTAEAAAFMTRDLAGADYVYLWVDGIHLGIRLGEGKLCLLVMIGVRADGRKELVALADGYRESAESWADLLRDCKRRGMRAPVLAVGDGALGFWTALREVFPQTREQRWFHRSANVLAALPKSAHPAAKKALAEIWGRRGQDPCHGRGEGLRRAVRHQVPEGGREDHRRPRRAARVLRLPRRALDPPTNHEPDRVNLRLGEAQDEGHPRAGQPRHRAGDGVQAHRVSADPLARGQRRPPGRARSRWRHLRQRQ